MLQVKHQQTASRREFFFPRTKASVLILEQSCTDPTFKHPSCTSICTGPNDHPYGWADVLECPLSSEWYCGWGNQSRCESGDTFSLGDGFIDDHRKKSHQSQATVTITESAPSCTSESNRSTTAGSNSGLNELTSTSSIIKATSEPFQGQAMKGAVNICTMLFLFTGIVATYIL